MCRQACEDETQSQRTFEIFKTIFQLVLSYFLYFVNCIYSPKKVQNETLQKHIKSEKINNICNIKYHLDHHW